MYLDDNTILIWLAISAICFLAGVGIATSKYIIFSGKCNKQKARLVALSAIASLLVPLSISFPVVAESFRSGEYSCYPLLWLCFFTLFLALFYNDRIRDTAFAKYNKREYKDAITYFEKEIIKYPNRAELYLYCAYSHYYLGQYEEALAVCDRYLAIKPDEINMLTIRATMFAELDKIEEAANEFSKLIEKRPDLDELYYLRANAYTQLYKYDLAIADLDKIKRPTIWATVPRCFIKTQTNRTQEAADEFHAMMSNLKDTFTKEHMSLLMSFSGFVRIVMRQMETAIQELTTAVQLYPKNSDAYKQRAFVYFVQGKLDLVQSNIECAEAVANSIRSRSHCIQMRSLLLWRRGDLDGAMEKAREAVNLCPGEANHLCGLGMMLLVAGRLEEAREALDRSIELDPFDAFSHWVRMKLFKKMGLDELALLDRQKVEEWKYRPYFEL